MKIANTLVLFTFLTILPFWSEAENNKQSQKQNQKSTIMPVTRVMIRILDQPAEIDPMIYGQMLEDCNDHIIYEGIVNKDGSERTHVTELLKSLRIPVVRWPAGTFIHEYNWENGIGPVSQRSSVDNYTWGGKETYRFGTDEFLAWCKKIQTVPYINLNMGNHPLYGGSLKEALNWIEYVNGDPETPYGRKRTQNGHPKPYHVKFWCIGNENYLSGGRHIKETAAVYSDKLNIWAGFIRSEYPSLQLLAVGHTYNWNDTVLQQNGKLVDFLTQHYYITSMVKDNKLQHPENSLFAPALVESHLEKLGLLIKKTNDDLGRKDHPIRICIDEWNNRHSVFNGVNYKFTRNDPRRQFDVAVTAQMLNIFIRQSPVVGMANYIFPVNGHGLLKTVGDTDAFKTPVYYVFEQYRNRMIGKKLDVQVAGDGISATDLKFSLEGDAGEMKIDAKVLHYVDAAAVLNDQGEINVAMVNRSPDKEQKVKITLPDNYIPVQKWQLSGMDINSANTPENRTLIIPKTLNLNGSLKDIDIRPCELVIIQFIPAKKTSNLNHRP